MLGRIAWTVSALWLLFAAAPILSEPPSSFDTAVVTEEGLLVPFARFDGTTWERLWREPGDKVSAPTSISVPREWFPPDGNVPRTWYLWLFDDPRAAASPFEQRTARTLTVQGIEVFPAHCLSQVGLRVDYRGPDSRQVDASRYPKRKAGVAVSVASVRVDSATILPPDSPLARVATDRAAAPFHRAEEEQIEILDDRERTKMQIPAFAARRSHPVTWTKVVRLGTAQAPSRTYYLEGEVAYSPAAVMAGHVWVQITGDRDTADAEVVLTDVDHQLVKIRTLLGVVRSGDRRFWVFETVQAETESYEVFEAAKGQRPANLLEVAAGGC